MIELTNAYSYFASAILLLGWILTNKQNGSKSIFGFGFFLAFMIYMISSYLHFSEVDIFLKKLSIELFALAGASFVLNKLKSSIFLNILLFVFLLTGFSHYVFHTNRMGGQEVESLDEHNELILELDHDVSIDILNEIKQKYKLSITKAYYPSTLQETELDDFFVVNIPDYCFHSVTDIRNKLLKISGVDWVEYNELINISPGVKESMTFRKSKMPALINDALVGDQWAFDVMHMDQYYHNIANYQPAKTAVLAILDTGIDSKHEDLKANFISIRNSYDNDEKGHGTHCAGIAGAVTNNKKGIASVVPDKNWVNITSIKVLNKIGGGTQNDIIKGIILAADKGVDVISMSLGARANLSRERAYKQAIAYANNKGAIVVVAAGNSNMNANTFSPANTHMAITVSAIDNQKNKASFSNYFTDMEYAIAAPGVDILSTVPGDEYKTNSGTSMAAPYVAGLVAMMKAIKPNLDTKEAIHILKKSGFETRNTQMTGKLINPDGAIKMLIDD